MRIFPRILWTVLGGIFCLLLLSYYSYCIYYIAVGGKNLGRLTQPLKSFALLPEKIYDFEDPIYPKWEGDERIGMAFNQQSESFGPNLFALTASYSMEGEKWRIELQDLKNDSMYHFWELGQKEVPLAFLGGSFVHMPIMMADSGLLVFFHGSNKLLRIDKNSQIIWRNEEFVFHHAMNLDT
ncbi:MAG: hypothetical protein AAF694_16005, partial [Bacteroidota bacterium]